MIEINLLPKELRKRAHPFHFDKKWVYGAAAVGFLFVVLFGVTFLKKHKISQLENKITTVQKQRKALEKDIRLIDGLTDIKQKLLTRMSAIEQLDQNRGMWVTILEDFSSRIPEMLWVTDFAEETPKVDKKKDRKPTRNRSGMQEEKDTIEVPVKRITKVEGYAYTLNSIASFMVGLMKSDFFQDVQLTFARQEKVEDISAYKYRINCVVNYDVWLSKEYQPEKTLSSPLAEH